MSSNTPIVLIPARLAATRLPDKPMADIHGEPMIVHVWRRAVEADIGPVVVATDSDAIMEAISASGGRAVRTGAYHLNGSSRINEALAVCDPDGVHSIIVNLQGDLPTVDQKTVRAVIRPLDNPAVDIGTIATEIVHEPEKTAPSVVKVVGTPAGDAMLRALYFTRATAPYGDGALYHHIGLYAFRREALARYVSLPPSPLELREKLEQLRALEAGMRIDVALVGGVPLGVDTQEDLDRARELLRPSR